jgi:hypothetical protein
MGASVYVRKYPNKKVTVVFKIGILMKLSVIKRHPKAAKMFL